jgi:PAS domain S-box-containing protein
MRHAESNWLQNAPAICPVTGLAITRRPEWTDIDLGDNYFVSFEFIGDRMLLSRSKGWRHASGHSIQRLFEERRKVLEQMLAPNEPFVEIRDYSHFGGISSKEARARFIAEMEKDKHRVMAFIGFNAPQAVKIGFRVWCRLFSAPFPISIEKDYQAALKKALAAARQHTPVTSGPKRKVVKFPQQSYATDSYRVDYEIIDDRIVHSRGRGVYTSRDVSPSMNNFSRVCAQAEKNPHGCYYINGLSNITRASRKARALYIEKIRRWHADFPYFRMIIFYGANRWMKAGIHLAKHLVPFKVKIVDDLESALAYIKVLDSAQNREAERPAPRSRPADAPAAPYPGPPHEILEFLGNISWGSGKRGIPDPPADADAAFRPVYDAIALIKMDLDELEDDRRQTENERQILAATIEQSTDSITITDSVGIILYCNPAFTRISGYTSTEAVGRHIAFIAQDQEAITKLDTLWREVTLGRGATQQITCHHKNGTPYLAETTVTQIISKDGETRNYATVQRDVTHEVQLEAQLKQIHKMEAIGTLAGGIAHDFNNILFPIIGYTEMSMDEAPPDSQLAQNLREILQAATRAKQLVKQILTFSKQDSSTRQPIDLVPVLQEAVSLLRASIPATVDIRQAIQRNTGRVLADPTQIHQVIVNLGSNAFHAMRETGGVMTIALKKVAITDAPIEGGGPAPNLPPGDYLKLSVTDTGHGIEPEISERIFDPFFTTKEMATNTGMGLSMIHGIITSHDGRILVASKPGRGTTFEIFLPEIHIPPVSEISPAEDAGDTPQTGHGHILIVDDEIQSAKIIEKMVSSLGYDTTAFTNSRKARDYFLECHHKVDLVITDLVMPRLTGDVLAAELRKIKPGIPVIICTGHREMLNIIDTTKYREILMKPVSRKDLAQAARRAINGKDES